MKYNQLFVLFFFALTFQTILGQNFETINPQQIEIVRDEWGVPHIFANTDAEVAYGLAWANAEDAFNEVQELFLAGSGLMGRYKGKEGAKADFFKHVIQAEALVEKQYNSLPKDFLRYLNGYVQGINQYAKLHPEQVKVKQLFPLTNKKVLSTYAVLMSFFTEAGDALNSIYSGALDNQDLQNFGSNAYAMSSQKTIDQNTYLCINPHLQMLGTFSFYEAHLQSKEGLNMYGALFYGGTSIYMGNNENLGWGMTWNHFDRGDIYKLTMHPNKKNTYLYDGKWEKLETKKVWLKVKLGKNIIFPVQKKSYWSKLGAVVKSSKNKEYYAFKFPAFESINASYQWYKMNKAKNFAEFKEALNLFGIGLFNIVYADKEDNIFYVSYGQVPYRKDSLVNLPYIDGSLSENVWKRLHRLDELPQALNPTSGFVFNTNNTPFHSTDTLNTTLQKQLPKYIAQRPFNNNRATRLHKLLMQNEKFNFKTFQKIKYDNKIDRESYIAQQIDSLFLINPKDYPEIEDMLQAIQSWDFEADSLDYKAAVFMVSLDFIFQKKGYSEEQFLMGFDANLNEMLMAIKEAKQWFLKHYESINVPLGKIMKAQKGEMLVTSPGFPGALSANYGKQIGNKYILTYGDTYTHFVRFNKNGVQEMRTAVPFGVSYNVEDKSYFNQAELFRAQQTKAVSIDKKTIYKNAVKIYNPK